MTMNEVKAKTAIELALNRLSRCSNMTYFLEKNYVLNIDGTLEKPYYGHILIRPCKSDYNTVLKFLKGKLSKSASITLEGQIASFNDDNRFSGTLSRKFSSLEEWLIWLELEYSIVPDFEEVHIQRYDNLKEYIVKTIDLHTKEVIYDSSEMTIEKLKKEINMNSCI